MGLFSYISGISNGNINNNIGNSKALDFQAIPDKDALRKNCDIDFIFEQYQNGNLAKWLRFHNCEREYIQIENIKANDKGGICQKLAEILQLDKVCGQEYIKMLEEENAKLKLQVAELDNKLKQTTVAGINKSMLKNLCVGDMVEFGRYYQDVSGEKRAIEWLVLDIVNNEALLISKLGLEAIAYGYFSWGNPNWGECSLREWLNNRFAKIAFNQEENKLLVSKNNNVKFSDKVFVLSNRDIGLFFPNDNLRKCKASEWAINNGASVDSSGMCYWWAREAYRNTGSGTPYAACVYPNGKYAQDGSDFNRCDCAKNAVRPAIWVKL